MVRLTMLTSSPT